MRTYPDNRIRAVLSETYAARKHLDAGEYAEARDAFLAMRAKAKKLGIESQFLAWGLAVAYDNLGELELAYASISEAMSVDPLSPQTQQSFEIISNRIRSTLADEARDPADPSTERLYKLLMAAGEADLPSHLAMARHLAATQRLPEAMRLMDAVTALAPVSKDGWLQKAAIARALGDLELAMRCDAEAAAISPLLVPYGIPVKPSAAC